MRGILAVCSGLLLASLGCGGPASTTARPVPIANLREVDPSSPSGDTIWFRDDTAAVGLDFVHEAGPIGKHFMPQIMGSGAALLDFDNDARFDLYLIQNGGPDSSARNKLYRQRADGRFEDVSAGSGLDIAGHGMGVAVGDIDNDGYVDIYVSQYGGGRLFRNRGNGTFEDITLTAGVTLSGWGTSAAFVDFDRDGWLDLVVVQYVKYDPALGCGSDSRRIRDYCHPKNFPDATTRLFHNRGRDAAGRWLGYEDVTVKAGLNKPGPGLGVTCADFDGDGWPDILVANDSKANHLWINRRDGTFSEEALARGLAFNGVGQVQANMGVALGDVSGSGRFDVFMTHLTEELNALWQQRSTGFFVECTNAAGLAGSQWRGTGFGTVLMDFDLDGALDLAIVNGRVSRTPRRPPTGPAIDPYWAEYVERNQLFVNDGKGQFRDISTGNNAFCGAYATGRGLVWGSFDNNGLIDLVVTSVAGPARFYRNIAVRKGHWLMVQAIDPALHRDAYGAVITIHANGRKWVGLVNPAQSYLCSGDPRVHFGLGSVTQVDSIQVAWPSGQVEVFPGVSVDRAIKLLRGTARQLNK